MRCWYRHARARILPSEWQNDVRGYLLTGDESMIERFKGDRERIDAAYRQLRLLVQDNPEQVIRADALIQAKDIWLQHAQDSVSQRAVGTASSDDWIRMGTSLMGDLRDKFDKFTDVEKQLQAQRRLGVRHMKQALAYVGGTLTVLLALTVGQSVWRQFRALENDYRAALETIEQRFAALKRSEADLEEQKEWFRVTLKSIGDGVMVTDRDGRAIFMNHEAERLTDWKAQEALLKPMTTSSRSLTKTHACRSKAP